MASETNGAEQLRRSIDLLWGDGERPSRGPKPSLTLPKIVEAAIAVADRDGITALSMRRVAAELGVGAMSLYRYVPGKAELLALMLDKVSGPSEDAERVAGEGWRTVIEAVARGAYKLYLDHRWLLHINWTRPVMGPNSLAGLEIVVGALDRLGVSDQEKMAVVITLDGFVAGYARQHVQYYTAAEESGISEEEFWSQHYPVLSKAMESGRYPAMAALDENAFGMSWDATFEFGLQRMLDGLAVLFESRTGAEQRAVS